MSITVAFIWAGSETSSSGSLDIGQDLRIVGLIRKPTDLGTLHGIVKPDALDVVSPGLAVVGQRFGKGPLTDLFNRYSRKSEKRTQVVVGLVCLGGDGRSAPHQFIVSRNCDSSRGRFPNW